MRAPKAALQSLSYRCGRRSTRSSCASAQTVEVELQVLLREFPRSDIECDLFRPRSLLTSALGEGCEFHVRVHVICRPPQPRCGTRYRRPALRFRARCVRRPGHRRLWRASVPILARASRSQSSASIELVAIAAASTVVTSSASSVASEFSHLCGRGVGLVFRRNDRHRGAPRAMRSNSDTPPAPRTRSASS